MRRRRWADHVRERSCGRIAAPLKQCGFWVVNHGVLQVHLCNNERLRVFMMWSIVLKESGEAAVVAAINRVRQCGHPPVAVKLHQAKSRYADKVVVTRQEWEQCSSVDVKTLPQDMHPLHAAAVCSSAHVVDVIIRSLANVRARAAHELERTFGLIRFVFRSTSKLVPFRWLPLPEHLMFCILQLLFGSNCCFRCCLCMRPQRRVRCLRWSCCCRCCITCDV